MWTRILKLALKMVSSDVVKDVVTDYIKPEIEVETLQSNLHGKEYLFVRVWANGKLEYNEKTELRPF